MVQGKNRIDRYQLTNAHEDRVLGFIEKMLRNVGLELTAGGRATCTREKAGFTKISCDPYAGQILLATLDIGLNPRMPEIAARKLLACCASAMLESFSLNPWLLIMPWGTFAGILDEFQVVL